MMNKKNNAFTLIELLIVVAIIAILAAIAVPNFLEAQTRAKVSRSKADIRSLATAIESYVVDNNEYMPFVPAIRGHIGERQLYLITTPIAYITSIPADTFQAGRPTTSTEASKNYSDWLGPIPRYFVYADSTFLLDGSTGWSVRSMGPDTDFDLVGYAPDNEGSFPGNGIYDPTNGTISNGDVLRSGGSIDFLR